MAIRTQHFMVHPGEIVLSSAWIDGASDKQLVQAVREMAELSHHPFLQATHCSGDANFDSVDEFFDLLREVEVFEASELEKSRLTRVRRSEFAAVRPASRLALIERDGHVCASPGCAVTENLTIDHVVPLSRGGTDDLANLRFMCASHNSSKGDKLPDSTEDGRRKWLRRLSADRQSVRMISAAFAPIEIRSPNSDGDGSAQPRHRADGER